MAVWYVVLIFVISFLTILISKKCRLKKQFPGPKGTPVIGVIWGLDLASLHLKLYEWSKLYGDIFQFSCLGKKFLVINSSDVLRELFLKEPNSTITADRPETFFGNYIYKNSDVVFASSDHKWARRRKLMYKLLHAYGEGLVDVERQIRYNLHSLTEEIRLLQNGTIDPSNIVEEFILNTIEVLVRPVQTLQPLIFSQCSFKTCFLYMSCIPVPDLSRDDLAFYGTCYLNVYR